MNEGNNLNRRMSARLLHNYFKNLVNQVYKILPMREADSCTLHKFIWRLMAEIEGGYGLYAEMAGDAYYASLLNILHYLYEHGEACSVEQTKQLVFEGIRLCERLSERFTEEGAP